MIVLSICANGCVECKSVSCIEDCSFSNWSSFGNCSAQCNGTRSRYRSLSGCRCSKNETEVETQACSSTTEAYKKGCLTCQCFNATEEVCASNCAITNETCIQIQDPLYNYVYEPPSNGSCCGSCRKVPSKYLFSIIK